MQHGAILRSLRTWFLLGIIISFAATAFPQQVANPTVTGPIATTAAPGDPSHGYPFFAANVDLASRGYVEQEFFFSGTAGTYTFPDQLGNAVPVADSARSYLTRMVVRRPISPLNFNGIVILEWQNVTAGYDFDALWIQSWEHLLRKGYAWIGVSAQPVAINMPVLGLKAWSPSRYGSLSVANDGMAFDIFSQAAQAVRTPGDVDPMGGLPVTMIIAAGASQSAERLVTYYNSIQPFAGVIDGFYIIAGGLKLRTDTNVKAFKLLTETDVVGSNQTNTAQWLLRQDQTDRFRRWELAGTAHLDYHFKWEGINALQVRDGLPATPPNCLNPPFSKVPVYYAANAALEHLVKWVKLDVPPPIGDDLIPLAPVDPVTKVWPLLRDNYGNAIGGIRLSQHEVATGTNTGVNLPLATACRMLGTHVPFDASTLTSLYPDHQAYLEKVIKATHLTQKAGFILGPDAAATISSAANSEIGRP